MSDFSENLLKIASSQAAMQGMQMRSLYNAQRAKSWDSLEAQLGIRIPQTIKSQLFSYATVSAFAHGWAANFKTRLEEAQKAAKAVTKAVINKEVQTFGQLKLFPEQQGVFDLLVKSFIDGKYKGALQDGYTGSGKMYLGTALIAEYVKRGIHLQRENLIRLHPFLIICPNTLIEKWARTLELAGLGELVAKRKIYIMSNAAFSTAEGQLFVQEHEDFTTGEVSLKWQVFKTPILTIIDESQFHINPKSMRFRALNALFHAPLPNKRLFMSATPAEKVNDTRIYMFGFDDVFLGERVRDDESFNKFALMLTPEPNKPIQAAAKRWRETVASHIFSIPYVRPKHKAINMVKFVEFEHERAAESYNRAHQRYIEARKRIGKEGDGGTFAQCIELNNFRRVAEPLRAFRLAEIASENLKSRRFATAIGCAYKETIAETVFQLNDRYGITRDQISVIWGGRKEYRPTEMLSMEEIRTIASSPAAWMAAIRKDPSLKKRAALTVKYMEEQTFYDETSDEQKYRHSRLKAMRLTGNQSLNTRQTEIDRFQNGQTLIVLFTIATGGVGLSFDRDKEHLLPRMGLFTPVYSGKEFAQLLGRLVRRGSISDADQYICMLKGTVEEWHVAPILDNKLRSIGEITNRNTDFAGLLANEAPSEARTVRTKDIAAKDAEADTASVADINLDTTEDEDEDES